MAVPATAQQRPVPPSQTHSSLQSQASVSVQSLSLSGIDALRAEDKRRSDDGGPYRYGQTLVANFVPTRHGDWEQLPSGDWVWRLRIRSEQALSLSVELSPFQLPSGAQLFLHDPDNQLVRGPYTTADATNGELWTPLVKGDELILELEVPQKKRASVDVVVKSVVHGYRSLASSSPKGATTKSGTCNLDVTCEEADPWRDQVRSVGGYTIQRGGDALVCTGTLVNNTGPVQRLLFLTAEHCVSTPEQASSMVFYWSFQTNTCRNQGSAENGTFPSDSLNVGSWKQTSTGALLQARYGNVHSDGRIAGKSDLALVEVDDAIPNDYNLYMSGWSRAGNTPLESTTIHHPSGHGKRISFDRDPSSLIDYPTSPTCSAPQGTTHLLVENWEVGTTEPGSSGSPLFNKNQRLVGVLSGGCAGCDGDGDAEDNNRPDWYGRVAPGFENGDFTPSGHQTPTTLADVLDPIDTGTSTLSGRPLQDTDPPAPVPNLAVSNVTPDSLTLAWNDTGDDGTAGTAHRYEIRQRRESPIQSVSDFEAAQIVETPPRPQSPGTRQSITLDINRDTSYHFAIRAIDHAGQASPITTADRPVTPVSALRVTTPSFPNPARERATVRFAVEEEQSVSVRLYDALGRQVQFVDRREVQPFRLETLRVNVSSLSSGIYFLRIRGETATRTEQIAVVK